MVLSKIEGYVFQIKTLGMAFVAGSLLVTGCSMNPSITQNEIEHQKPLVSTNKNDKSKDESGTKQGAVSTVSHEDFVSSADSTESLELIKAEAEQLLPAPLEPIQAPATGEQVVLNSSMTLQELESIALENNPAIQELAASTQKAAGYRTQVTTRPNPLVGYSGQQLADRGTDQHLAFIEREFVTANKLELNNRVLNATLSAQLQELEAQRYRVSDCLEVCQEERRC